MPLKLHPPGKRGPYYVIRGTIGGRQYEKSTGTTDKALAEEYRIKWETELQQRRILGPMACTTFSEAVNMYLDADGSERFLLPLIDYFGITVLKDITYARIMEAAKNIYPRCKPATIQRQVITPVSAVMKFAHKAGLGPNVTFPRMKETSRRLRWLTPEEMEALLKASTSSPHLPPIISLLASTGARVGTLLGLPARDYVLSSREVILPPVKGGSPRVIQVPARTMAAISRLDFSDPFISPIRTPKGKPYVIRKGSGGQIQEAFNQARTKAGLGEDVTPHTLRHTWSTWRYAMTQDMMDVKRLGGWKTYEMVERYTKIAPRDLPERLVRHGWYLGENMGGVSRNAYFSIT